MPYPYKKIFAAIDNASTQKAVLSRAIVLAETYNASLVLGHVVDSIPYETTGSNFGELLTNFKTQIKESLADDIMAIEENPNIPEVRLEVAIGRVADTLVETMIEEEQPDVVVCGERGFSNLKYAFVGSVSLNIVRKVRCDVLMLKVQ